MSALYGVVGTSNPDHLLSDPQGADIIAIPCTPGKGVVKRGTVMFRESNGMWSPAASANISTSNQLAILNVDVDTDANPAVAEDAAAYRAGRFINGRVKYDNSGTLTAVTEAHKVVLRLEGIVFDVADNASGFNNGSVVITYIANNGASPAEADVVKNALHGSSYTILGNSGADGTGFTAPATKSFSKWNTKADGSGTDYAAAASYTADADLTLYAVWA